MNQKALFGFLVMTTLTLQGCGMNSTPTTTSDTTTSSTTETTQENNASTDTQTTTDDTTTNSDVNTSDSQTSMLNGTFDLTDTYQTHGGPEKMEATVTIKDDVITAVEAKNVAVLPMSKKFQDEFKEGIAGQIVGKNIKDVNVTKVNGSSLTAQSFNKALHALQN